VPAAHRAVLADALVCAGGDVMLGSNLDTAWARTVHGASGGPLPLPHPDQLIGPVRTLVEDAAIVLVNVEGAIGDGPVSGKCRPGSTRCYQFRQPVAAASGLRRLLPGGTVVGNVANNHAMDAGLDGFEATVGHLRDADVVVTGVDSVPAAVALPSGDTVAFLGFSTFAAGLDARDLDAVRRHVARAAARYRHVIVNVHIGAEGRTAQRTRDEVERFAGENRGNPVAFARAAVEAGAAVVFGHGPHVLRAAEWHGRSLIVYSLGNLLTHGPFNRDEPSNRGGFACVRLSREGGVFWAEFRSIFQERPGVAYPDPSHRAAHLVDSLSALDFPATGARVLGGVIFRR
jgi:poly-gamma-glutamate capsule biosynthesis protein CapA/YwtB (metallophosphatase superfamily)